MNSQVLIDVSVGADAGINTVLNKSVLSIIAKTFFFIKETSFVFEIILSGWRIKDHSMWCKE